MSESFDVNAQPRQDAGKGASRRLRRNGLVPGIVYGAQREPELISLAHNELAHHLEEEGFYSRILDLKVGDKVEKVVIKDLQRHPARPFVLHVDFQRIIVDEKIRMTVPLHFVDEATSKGAKQGGRVAHNLTEVEVSCLPKDLPEFIDIDMSEMDIGDIVHLSEIRLPANVALAHSPDPDVPVVVIHSPQAQEEEPAAGGEEGAEPAEPKEPES
jgi:large subunit ribosomal protein L25